ncbi:VWFA domain-containing protein [Mycena kentingensis (nom. inval.)]|nr:VWFA domain-containing protein [Mycena kentingensis (nom. inval.)]
MPPKPKILPPIASGASDGDESGNESAYYSPAGSASDDEPDARVTGTDPLALNLDVLSVTRDEKTEKNPTGNSDSRSSVNISSVVAEGKGTQSPKHGETTTGNIDMSQNTKDKMTGASDTGQFFEDAMNAEPLPPVSSSLDLLPAVRGLFRVLDLISETGSGGLVDKIIISQDSLKELINQLSPGAYTPQVNFKALDKVLIKPLGIYGSKSEIVAFLSSCGAVDDETSRALLHQGNEATTPTLRSGLYVLRMPKPTPDDVERAFVIYWPEPTTWSDGAISSVRRNRVTFLRYLTKISDQLVCLISPEHAQSIVWIDEPENMQLELEDEGADRMYTFEVEKTHEQEEDVSVRPGFNTQSSIIAFSPGHVACPIDDADLQPTLVHGETVQAILTRSFAPGRLEHRPLDENYNALKLTDLLNIGAIRLQNRISDDGLRILGDHGLQKRFPILFKDWRSRNDDGIKAINEGAQMEEHQALERLQNEEASTQSMVSVAVVDQILRLFPTVSPSTLSSMNQDELRHFRAEYAQFVTMYPAFQAEIDELRRGSKAVEKFEWLSSASYRSVKEQVLYLHYLFVEKPEITIPDREDLVKHVAENGIEKLINAFRKQDTKDEKSPGLVGRFFSLFSSDEYATLDKKIRNLMHIHQRTVPDGDFLTTLEEITGKEPLLLYFTTKAAEIAVECVKHNALATTRALAARAMFLQEQFIVDRLGRKSSILRDQLLADSRARLLSEYNRIVSDDVPAMLIIDKVERVEHKRLPFRLVGTMRTRRDPTILCHIYPLRLTADAQDASRLDPSFIPELRVSSSDMRAFTLGLGQRVLHAQITSTGHLLLIIVDDELLCIFYEPLAAISDAVSRWRDAAKCKIHRNKIGMNVLLAYDEQKRILSLCSASELSLHIYVFDETFGSLRSLVNALDLRPWYTQETTLIKSCFIAGCEEVLFVDAFGTARIFSLVTQQFRPASLSFDHLPETLGSTPDGACLVISSRQGRRLRYRSFHWDTFGSSPGIDLGILDLPDSPATLSSLVHRRMVHLVSLDPRAHVCRSVFLDIKKKVTELTFKERATKNVVKAERGDTAYNCLVDVHADVWTRFPVVAAVERQTISSGRRCCRQLIFVTERDHDKFSPHFSDLIYSFEQRTRKPTGDVLKNTKVSALSPLAFYRTLPTLLPAELTTFNAGEWIVDLLCLIPIQIALARDNRFLPLKDGVVSAELERSLLGAEPVKVVSSMGEQSVGKSYTLNHLLDTSFAGSAMRTTEGVWMSVTPTNDTLIVALDFEGVHSIERSTQEDTLLVLFNTALSNLVLFRNNFAMSRSITGLFQSFQSSSAVLDPAANPSLFRSTLTIIIKDVVESDKNEIVREFSTKFHKIVEEEQEANFISRLHAGALRIIPWPVIESRQFYALFPGIKRLLDSQEVTHHTAGEFLHTLKTLMAKLKANDWGALSQNLAAHRAQKLLDGLDTALKFGVYETDDVEPLKNFDTDHIIDKPDTASHFFLATEPDGEHKDISAASRDAALVALINTAPNLDRRSQVEEIEWLDQLQGYLTDLVETRIEHVREWISSNLMRFKENQANVEILRRVFSTTIVELRSGVELCGTQCADCQLKCLLVGRHHPSVAHNCRTDHSCHHLCDFGDDDDHPVGWTSKQCGLPAGHAGRHICAVDIHLCGEPCALQDRPGCLASCMKSAGHEEDDHLCAARRCDLKNIKVGGGMPFSCSQPCAVPCDEDHYEHVCDSAACPIACELCKRLCSERDHLHGLRDDAVHLCGQEHSCAASCQEKGICQIETTPQAIDAVFNGVHERFTYTKARSQRAAIKDKYVLILPVAKRRQCVFPIPPGQKVHEGRHSHSQDVDSFHYCETKCENCGYFCTLPRGHSQQEHETSHGSMTQTQWAVDGPDGTIVVLKGRMFGASDEGAPMLCNLVCQDMGRHVHIDYCRADDAASCDGPEVEHVSTRMLPNPERAKDCVSHSLSWRRSGFKDPYSREDQANFAKCDAMCPDPEHVDDTTTTMSRTSYCTLPLFHPPAARTAGLGYLSNDGHIFNCKNPTVIQNAFHVIFVIDRSSSMGHADRRPLANVPSTRRITRHANNRLGAVYSALHGFWISRNAALAGGAQGARAANGFALLPGNVPAPAPIRRDAYSVVLFDRDVSTCITNDFASTPDALLNVLLEHGTGRGTNFTQAIDSARIVMERHWSNERSPVVIFLSDGEARINDDKMRTLCRRAIALGRPLSFHAVSFGRESQSGYLRRMADVALEVQNNAPAGQMGTTIDSSYSEALDTVRLAETFLGFAESLRKPRGALVSTK